MGLTDYRALLIDCDEVLVDRDSGVWAALQPLLDSRGGQPSREQVLAEFNAVVAKLYPRFAELGFSGVLCFAHRQLAEAWGLHASWEEGMSFARSAGNWSLFEDAPGAMLYLRKFYRLLVRGDRDAEDRGGCASDWGLHRKISFPWPKTRNGSRIKARSCNRCCMSRDRRSLHTRRWTVV